MRVRIRPELLHPATPPAVEPMQSVRVRVPVIPPRHKPTHAVMLYGGTYDYITKKFDPTTPEIDGFTASGWRCFRVRRVGPTHTTLIETGEFEQLEFKCENDMWRQLVAKGRKL